MIYHEEPRRNTGIANKHIFQFALWKERGVNYEGVKNSGSAFTASVLAASSLSFPARSSSQTAGFL